MPARNLMELFAQSACRCPAYDVHLTELQLSRYCPLAVELFNVVEGEYLGIPFGCASYRLNEQKEAQRSIPKWERRTRCPLEERMVDEALRVVC